MQDLEVTLDKALRQYSKVYKLLETARKLLRLPLGIVIHDHGERAISKVRIVCTSLRLHKVITVGDIVTINVCRYWRIPDLAVVDGRTRRDVQVQGHLDNFDVVVTVTNERATISLDVIDKLWDCVHLMENNKRVLVVVQGEEDVLAIPLILLARNGLVLYGNVFIDALVAVPVSLDYKLAVLKLLAEFRRCPQIDHE